MGLMGIHVSAHLPLHTLEQSEDLQIGIQAQFGMSQTCMAVHEAQKHEDFVCSSLKQTQREQQHLPIQVRDGCKSAADDNDGSLVW